MKVNQLKSGVLLSYISMFIMISLNIIYTPIMLRLLGQEEYGLYSLIGSVVSYLTILDMGMGNAIIRYTARNRTLGDQEAESNLNGMFLIIYSIIGVLAVVIGTVVYFNIENIFDKTLNVGEIEKAKIMMILMIFNLALSFPLGIFGSIIQAHEKFIFVRLVSIAHSTISPCIILPLLFWGYGSVALVAVNMVLNIICLLIDIYYCFNFLNTKIYFKRFDFVLLKEIAGYSFFIFLNVIMDKVYWSTGQFILGIVSGTVMVAVYAIAMQLNMMYMMFSTSISGVLFPRITMMVANNCSNDDLSQQMIKVGRIQYVVMAYILSGFVLFGKAFITIWAGPQYSDAYYIALLVMIPITIPLIQNVGISILQAKNRNAFRAIVYVIIAIINVLASIPLAKIWGGLGCALATGVSLLIGNVIIINVYYHKCIGLNMLFFWRNIAEMSMPVMVSLVCGLGISYFSVQNSWILLAVKIVLFSIVYISLMWFLGLNLHEKNIFLSPVKKVRNRIQLVRRGFYN